MNFNLESFTKKLPFVFLILAFILFNTACLYPELAEGLLHSALINFVCAVILFGAQFILKRKN